MMNLGKSLILTALFGGALMVGCGSDGGDADGADGGAGGAAAGGTPGTGGTPACEGTPAADTSGCQPGAMDYQPRAGMPGTHGWAACISDDNTWHMINPDIPAAVSRSIAFESMAGKLWNNTATPTAANFLEARDEYSVDEGLASRVGRRQDVTYPEVPGDDKFACANAGVPEMYPDRCAAPAKLKPIIDDAFTKGAAGEKPWVQAARIEASLLWFFHLSMTSEVWTCSFDDITDCDSAAGYYTQISARGEPKGLAAYVQRLDQETHDRIYDALLAERCWRDIDQMMPATDASKHLYDMAQDQLQKAANRGQALILRDRIDQVGCLTGEAQEAQIEFVKILGGLLDHAARTLDAGKADTLKAYTSAPSGDAARIAEAIGALDAIFACP